MQVQQGLDGEAFAALFARTHDALYGYVAALMLDRLTAEDVVQRAFELAFARRATFRPELGSADAWLFRIARNVALDERRRLRRRSAVVSSSEPPEPDVPDRGLQLERTDRESALFTALMTLSEDDRQLIALKFWAEMSHGEIAAVLACSESNVGTRVHRAIRRLREVLNAEP